MSEKRKAYSVVVASEERQQEGGKKANGHKKSEHYIRGEISQTVLKNAGNREDVSQSIRRRGGESERRFMGMSGNQRILNTRKFRALEKHNPWPSWQSRPGG